jgi:RNA polymerase sigma-70 factor, ECF subfamily
MQTVKHEDERQLTRLLAAMNAGEAGASDELAEHIFDDLRAMARRRLKADGADAGVSIQPTMLASDTLMKLIRQREQFDNGGHLFAIASRVMMRLLIDYHRARRAAKRGGAGDFVRVSLDPEQAEAESGAGDGIDVEALDAALEKLAALDARKADVVKYRVLWGLTTAQIAQQLEPKVSVVTVERDWAFAKAWLAKELSDAS